MSHYWGLHCKPCNSNTEAEKNHGEQIMSDFARMASLFVQLRDLDSCGYLEIGMMGGSHNDLIGWLCEHADHEMMLIDEYGRIEPLREARKTP